MIAINLNQAHWKKLEVIEMTSN